MLENLKTAYDIAKTITNGVPLFSKILNALKRNDLLRMYFYFDSRFHTLGFYEMITPEDELEEIIRTEVPEWIEEMANLVNSVRGLDL